MYSSLRFSMRGAIACALRPAAMCTDPCEDRLQIWVAALLPIYNTVGDVSDCRPQQSGGFMKALACSAPL
jgi:hypothetical protein